MTRSYNLAAITADGRTISTQLWHVSDDEPRDVLAGWTKRDPQLTGDCPVVVAPMGGDAPVITTVRAYLSERVPLVRLYRVTDPMNDGALIMVAPLETIRRAFQPTVAPERGIGPRITHETENGGVCDLHFNNQRPLGLSCANVQDVV